jgi:Flp pilus assembly protein TadG
MVGEAPAKGKVKEPFADRLPHLRAVLERVGLEEAGTALVEFALIAPVLFLLIFGVVDFGRALNYFNQQSQLVGLAARAASVNRNPDGTAVSGNSIQTQTANTYAKGELSGKTSVCLSGGATVGQPVTVTATYQFHFLPLIGAALGLGGSSSINITASQTERQEVPPTFSAGCAT